MRKKGIRKGYVGGFDFGLLVAGEGAFIVEVVVVVVVVEIIEVAIVEVVTGEEEVLVAIGTGSAVLGATSVAEVVELSIVSFFSRRLFHFFLRAPPTLSTFSAVFSFSP